MKVLAITVGGIKVTVVANYSALPSPTIVPGEFYWCSNSEGTAWLPGSLGGTYYPSGMYYSNGITWEYIDTPYQATQAEVDAGIINDKFVSPFTLKNAEQWDTKVNVADLPATLIFYPTTTASPVSGYFKLVTDITDPDYDNPAVNVPTGTITTTNQLIAELASDQGVIIGNPGVVNMVIVGNIRRTTMSGTASFYYEVYHRDNLGTETLIATSSTTFVVNTNTYTEFYAPALINNGTFTATDRVVFKFYGNKVSSPDSAYEFQFGGTQPVRASFPVPFNVIPITGGTWGSITGTLSAQTDLQTALDAKVNSSITDTGVLVDFTTSKIFNTPTSPATGNITEDLTNAKIGIVQKIYHNDSVAPTFPVGWVKIDGEYVVSIENIIFAEWISGTRVEYWIVNASTAGYVVSNSPITGATKTKITYDSKGLVTAGADATTADIADSSNKRYVTDANLTVIGNTSGTNTGDQDLSGLVPTSRNITINGTTQDLSADRTYSAVILSGQPNAINAGTLGVPRYFGFSDNNNSTAETLRRIFLPNNCTLKNFYIRTGSSQPASGSHVLTILKNGVATSITVTIPGGSAAGVFSDTTNSVSFLAGDEISIEAVNNASTSSSTLVSFTIGNL